MGRGYRLGEAEPFLLAPFMGGESPPRWWYVGEPPCSGRRKKARSEAGRARTLLTAVSGSPTGLRFDPSRTSSSLLYAFSDAAAPQSYDLQLAKLLRALPTWGENAPTSVFGVLRTLDVTGAHADVSDCCREWTSEPPERERCISSEPTIELYEGERVTGTDAAPCDDDEAAGPKLMVWCEGEKERPGAGDGTGEGGKEEGTGEPV